MFQDYFPQPSILGVSNLLGQIETGDGGPTINYIEIGSKWSEMYIYCYRPKSMYGSPTRSLSVAIPFDWCTLSGVPVRCTATVLRDYTTLLSAKGRTVSI